MGILYKIITWSCSEWLESAIIKDVWDVQETSKSSFSWQILLFGPVYTALKGDFVYTLLLIGLYLPLLPIVLETRFTGCFGFFLMNLVFAFTYRRQDSQPAKPVPTLLPADAPRPGKDATLPVDLFFSFLDDTPRGMWAKLAVSGNSTAKNSRGITVGKLTVPKGYQRLCGFLPYKEDKPVKDVLENGTTILIKEDDKEIWKLASDGETHLVGVHFTKMVKPGSLIKVLVKGGVSHLDNLLLVIVNK